MQTILGILCVATWQAAADCLIRHGQADDERRV
jgi:hypothetical protein